MLRPALLFGSDHAHGYIVTSPPLSARLRGDDLLGVCAGLSSGVVAASLP